jgi:tetratricopeptide (TPR) repeat protein
MTSPVDLQVEKLVSFLSNALETGGSPILWVGAGASAAAGYPALGKLEEILRQRLPGVEGDAYHLVDAYVDEYSRADLAQLLQKHLGVPRPFAPIHEAVARLAAAEVFPLLFTTNYDRLLENALTVAETPFVVQSLQDNAELQAMDQVQVLKMHGDLGNWMDVVLTSYSYREFHQTWPLLRCQLDQSLRTHPVVFVGCSMTDPRLLDWLQGLSPAERSRLFASRAILTDDEWGRLPAATRELLGSANVKPILVPDHAGVTRLLQEVAVRLAPLPVKDLVFELEPGEDEWTVTGPTPESPRHQVANPWQDPELGELLAALAESVGIVVPLGSPEAADVEAALERLALRVSDRLTPVLLSEAARREVLGRMSQVDLGRARLVIRVRDESAPGSEALALPWELLAPRAGELAVREARLDVVREAVLDQAPSLPEPTGPLTVAVTIAAPEDQTRLDYEKESFRLQGALTALGQRAAFSDLGGLDDFAEVVEGQQAAVVHFSGHGLPGGLVFEDGHGFSQTVPVAEVVRRLHLALPGPGPFPRLFFLASCHGATVGEGPSTAAALHRCGFVQVVGYFGPVGDELSTRAEERFYRALAEGETTLHAAAEARATLSEPLESGGGRLRYPLGWTQLAVYHRGPDRPLALPGTKAKPADVFRRRLIEVSGLPVLEHGFVGRRGLQHEIRRRVERDGQRLIVLQGLGGLGKTALASQLLSRSFAPDVRDQLILRGRGLDEEPDPIAALRSQAEEHGKVHRLPQWEERLKRLREEVPEPAAGFAATIGELRRDRPGFVLYVDNAESLQDGPQTGDPGAIGSWQPAAAGWWAEMEKLARDGLVLVSTRYGWKGLAPGAWVPVGPMSQADVLRLLDTFPGFRLLARKDRERLASRVDGHPRTLEILDRLIQERSTEQGPGFEVHDPWKDLIEPVLPRHAEEIRADLLLEELWQRLTPAAREHAIRIGVFRVPAPRFVVDRLGAATPELIRTGVLTRFREQMEWEDRTEWIDRWGLHSLVRSFLGSKSDRASWRAAHLAAGGAYEEWMSRPGASWSDREEGIHHLHAAGEGDRAWPMVEKLVFWLRHQARYRDALGLLERCEPAGASGERLAMALMLQVQMRRELGERSLDLARMLERALELASSDKTRSLVLGEYGGFRLERKEHAEAESLLRQALVIKKKAWGARHPEYAASLHELSGVLAGQGKYSEAEDLLWQTLEIRESLPTLTNLADLLAVQGRAKEGEPLVERALGIARREHGDEHPAVAQILTIQARVQAMLGRPEAAATARRALEALEASLGPEHPMTRQGEAVLDRVLADSEEREEVAQHQEMEARVVAVIDKVRDDAIAALRGEEDWDDSLASIEELAANVEGLGSSWSPLGTYLRAVLAVLDGGEAPAVGPHFAERLAAVEATARRFRP